MPNHAQPVFNFTAIFARGCKPGAKKAKLGVRWTARVMAKSNDECDRWDIVWSTAAQLTHLYDNDSTGPPKTLCGIVIPPLVGSTKPIWESSTLMQHARHSPPFESVEQAIDERLGCVRCAARWTRERNQRSRGG